MKSTAKSEKANKQTYTNKYTKVAMYINSNIKELYG